MYKRDYKKKYEELDKRQRELLQEYMWFSLFSEDIDFNNYTYKSELNESEVFSIIDLLYQQDCYLMLSDFLIKYSDFLVFDEIEKLDQLDDKTYKRLRMLERKQNLVLL